MVTITESSMSFGPFDEQNVFHIEKSEHLQSLQKNCNSIQIAEFLLLQQQDEQTLISIIEAKSSSPKDEDKVSLYIEEIQNKLTNSLMIFTSFHSGRHLQGQQELTNSFKNTDLSQVKFQLILVIKNSKKAWLPPISEALKKSLKPTVTIWNLSATSVKVFNEDQARNKHLIN